MNYLLVYLNRCNMMERVNIIEKNFSDVISRTKEIIQNGGIVATPTDTVYGLLGDATSQKAIKKIFLMKGRPNEKALPVFVKDIAMARRFAYISDKKAKILSRVWPGPVTVVFHHKEKLPQVLTGNLGKIALRIPENQFLSELLLRVDMPLVQTSANISGSAPAKTADEVVRYFGEKEYAPDLLIDGNDLLGMVSTVIDFSGVAPVLLRAGLLGCKELQDLLDRFS